MTLLSTLRIVLLLVSLASFHILTDEQRAEHPNKLGKPKDQGKKLSKTHNRQQRSASSEVKGECQKAGFTPGQGFSGSTNITASGRTCQHWAASRPHVTAWTDVGRVGNTEAGNHNHCRNPNGDPGGVWCYTTDPDMTQEYCSIPICPTVTLKVLDFSSDNDNEPDDNGEHTSATLDAGPLPESFTICSAFMVKAWTTADPTGNMFQLPSREGKTWGRIYIHAHYESTEYRVQLGPVRFNGEIEAVFFPLQWIRVCLSLDSVEANVKLVVDGVLMEEREYSLENDWSRPENLILMLGYGSAGSGKEFTGKVTELNIFKSALSAEKMKSQTTAGEEECGLSGDLVSWEEAEWTLHSQAKVIEVDRDWEGPCRRESKVQVFISDFKRHIDCMQHCQKISNGISPTVTTQKDWETLTKEIGQITPIRSKVPKMWLSATEGDKNLKLARLDHWPETEVVDNQTIILEANETIWRDFYTGQRLENWTKPYINDRKQDALYHANYNCMQVLIDWPWYRSWLEWECKSHDSLSCPCSYPVKPLLRLRGLCPTTRISDTLFSPRQLPDNPSNMIILGKGSTRIEFNNTDGRWMLTDVKNKVSGTSTASERSYLLGKHNWTISNDHLECNEGLPYKTMLKLTGCRSDEFTCDDGQCIKMERRCDQVTGKEPNCRDKSDENGCQLIVFENNHNKNIPPIESGRCGCVIPTNVSISITLMKVVDIEETDHSIQLQFQISLQWKENRVKFLNLKKNTALNSLTDADMRTIWLPLIVFDNTDQKDVTRLGMDWEWITLVTVSRSSTKKFTRSGLDQIDEAEIFEGAENTLTMNQTYTLEFQCKYHLQRYPFDTQVPCTMYMTCFNTDDFAFLSGMFD